MKGAFVLDVMKPVASDVIPNGEEWSYEVKYDGFRCVLYWAHDKVKLTSKNNLDLTGNFPEIIEYCLGNQKVAKFLPVKLDGELVVLNNPYQANFSWIQKRGRLKSNDSIQKAIKIRHANFMAFDILQHKGEDLYHKSFRHRKGLLNELFKITKLDKSIRLIEAYENQAQLWQIIYEHKGEGMIAKRNNSLYLE